LDNGIHFISGLPRSGSTLLSALLRQNPRQFASMTSPVGSLFNAMLRETSQRSEAATFIDDGQRARLLSACFDAYYGEIHPTRLVFDTNRGWTTKLPALIELFPNVRMICCVRNPAWVADSLERVTRNNKFELSGIFGYEPGGTVYSRVDALSAPTGMIGYAFSALREAVYGTHADRLMLLRYESLSTNPLGALEAIYDFIGEPRYPNHDSMHIEQDYDAMAFDGRIGTPGLHEVGSAVYAEPRPTLLPPDLFARLEKDAFWNDPKVLPPKLRIV
jgi:sulfotransferase